MPGIRPARALYEYCETFIFKLKKQMEDILELKIQQLSILFLLMKKMHL